ncbi:polyphenol oxidase family protein [Spirobacillus cienkowskii]|uniref:polyphenol oxidase family protein n=1 Tax=Spirobacillus cienkowskii TaxID=495820 RepID=UPI0030CBC71B
MKLFSHLCPNDYPFLIPQSFFNVFEGENIAISENPYLLSSLGLAIPSLKNRVLFSLNDPLPHSFILKTFHSSKVVEACDPSPRGDAQYLVTNVENIAEVFHEKKYLAIKTADCLPVVFCFRKSNVFAGAVCHAGWRGFSAQILQSTVELLIQKVALFNINRFEFLASLQMFIGPAIFGVSYECGLDVQKALSQHRDVTFSNYHCEDKLYKSLFDCCSDLTKDSSLLPYLLNQKRKIEVADNVKVYPDLQLLAALEAVVIGLNQKNISILRENTYGHPTLFSFRQATHRDIPKVTHQWTHLCFIDD